MLGLRVYHTQRFDDSEKRHRQTKQIMTVLGGALKRRAKNVFLSCHHHHLTATVK